MFRGYMMANSPLSSDGWSGNDATSRPVLLPRRPERIISLVPSQTELLVDLGVAERLVGRTRYCIHPQIHLGDKLSSVAVIGGTKRVELDKIEVLKPDFILAEKEENPLELVNSLSRLAPVYVTDVTSIPSAIAMCRDVGKLVGLIGEANALAAQIETTMKDIKNSANKIVKRPERVLYLIWRKPWMAAGPGTFIHSCLEHIGFENAVNSLRYPELDRDALIKLNPDRVFLSSEPFPFKETHAQELRETLPHTRFDFVDGELFSWYGSRMLKMPDYWRTLIS
jgi:ABC-type Fe3+-hydroxamate transport system substrate-binding protein